MITEQLLLKNGFKKIGQSYPHHRFELWMEEMGFMFTINEIEILDRKNFTLLSLIKKLDEQSKMELDYKKSFSK